MLEDAFASVLPAAATGAAWAYRRLWDDLSPLVAGYVRLHGGGEVDELVSEVFLAVFNGIAEFQGTQRQFRSWVLVIAHRRLIDEYRRGARRVVTQPLTPPGQPDWDVLPSAGGRTAEEEALSRMSAGWVHKVLARLTEDQRTVLLLRIVGEQTITEIATAMDKRPTAVKALQRRGLATLRQIFEQEGVPL